MVVTRESSMTRFLTYLTKKFKLKMRGPSTTPPTSLIIGKVDDFVDNISHHDQQ
jgi:hypothetical protein